MPPKVYLSPAYHSWKPCAVVGCDETTHNNQYLDILVEFLDSCGIAWKRGPRRIPKSTEDGTVLMKAAVRESDDWGADVHYVSHTNASTNSVGGGKVRGYRPIIYAGSVKGLQIANCIMHYRKEIYDQPMRLNERTDLYELRVPKAPSYYEEHIFHDCPADAEWFHDNMRAVARATAKGFCAYFNIPYVEPARELYRVQVGAFRDYENARNFLNVVRQDFPEAFITTVYKD